ncbi:restriction endonuclease subunit S [Occultella kanbiaonis]|uniref:restriction endonuclease subunit S n=1 Tax=Occultella kanbiaonis TaxID=2675754 RepID=UPI001F15D507|nr:restriction endonuclease subunit S [Occultella kanbiaonis]
MRKSLGDKRKYLPEQAIDELVRLYDDLPDDDPRVKVLPNASFGFQRLTVERPLRRRWEVTEQVLDLFGKFDDGAARASAEAHLGRSFSSEKEFTTAIAESVGSLTAPQKRSVLKAAAVPDPDAEPVTKKGAVEPDPDLRDAENIPLPAGYPDLTETQQKKALHASAEAHLRTEIHTYVPDAWIDHAKTKIGYEIPFTRQFYVYTPPRPVAEIAGEIQKLEDQTLTSAGLKVGSALAPAGAVLLSTRAPIGYTALIDRPMAFNQGCKALIPGGELEQRYLQYALIAHRTDLQQAGQGATFRELRNEALMSTRINHPPLQMQRRIADFLDDQIARVDMVIATRRKQRELLESSWIGRVDEVLSVFDAPAIRLSRLGTVQSGLTVNAGDQRVLEGGRSLPYLSVANVKDGYLDLATVKEAVVAPAQAERHLLRDGDVLMTEGGDFDKLGRGTVWEGQISPCLHQNHVFAVRPAPELVYPWFLSFQTQSSTARTHFMLTASKSTNLASTSSGKVLAWRVLLPPIERQRQSVLELRRRRTNLESALDDLTRSIGLLTEYKQSLITAAVSGDFDVTTASGRLEP